MQRLDSRHGLELDYHRLFDHQVEPVTGNGPLLIGNVDGFLALKLKASRFELELQGTSRRCAHETQVPGPGELRCRTRLPCSLLPPLPRRVVT